MTELHPDPIGDSGQKAFQYVQLLAMAAEAVAVIMAARARAAAERDQQRADALDTGIALNHKVAADLWQPVLADHHRETLDVAQTLTAWSAAQAWKDTDSSAQQAADLAEERLHDLRPAAMMRYDDLRSQGLDPVAAMRHVVQLLDANPRIGETSTATHARRAIGGPFPDTAAIGVPADESDAEQDGHQAPYLSGYELTYGGDNRTADGRDIDGLDRDHVAAVGVPGPRIDAPQADAPTAAPQPAPGSSAPVDAEDAAALLVTESALLTQIEQHRMTPAQEGRLASGENSVAGQIQPSDQPVAHLIDEHHDAVRAAIPPVALNGDAGAHAHIERDAAQALAASYPTAVRDVTAASSAAPPASPSAATARTVAKSTAARAQ